MQAWGGSVARIAKSVVRTVLYVVVSLLPANDDIWVFVSHAGEFSENSKYQFLYSSAQNDVRAVWISQNDSIVSSLREAGYEAYSYRSLVGKYLLLRSGYLFLTHGWQLRPYSGNSTIVQLWHGNMLKRMGGDHASGGLQRGNYYEILRDLYYERFGRDWDYFVVTSSSYPAQHAKSAYNLGEEDLLIAGYPRTDVLLRDVPDSMLGVGSDARNAFETSGEEGPVLCLFPTWNGGRDAETRFSKEHVDLESLDHILESFDARMIIKQHPSTPTLIDDSSFENIVVVPESIDIYPLLERIDVLITDYSSIFFDFLLLDRPILFYPYDFQRYVQKRGLYFDYPKFVPGPKAFTAEELNDAIESVLQEGDEYEEQRRRLRDEFFDSQDGKSAERIHDFVKSTM